MKRVKKWLGLLLASAFILALVGCADTGNDPSNGNDPSGDGEMKLSCFSAVIPVSG